MCFKLLKMSQSVLIDKLGNCEADWKTTQYAHTDLCSKQLRVIVTITLKKKIDEKISIYDVIEITICKTEICKEQHLVLYPLTGF